MMILDWVGLVHCIMGSSWLKFSNLAEDYMLPDAIVMFHGSREGYKEKKGKEQNTKLVN